MVLVAVGILLRLERPYPVAVAVVVGHATRLSLKPRPSGERKPMRLGRGLLVVLPERVRALLMVLLAATQRSAERLYLSTRLMVGGEDRAVLVQQRAQAAVAAV